MHRVKPLTIEKQRRQAAEEVGREEQSQYRGLCGTLAWPAAQLSMHGAASVSLAQAKAGKATIRDMLDLNEVLRFMKEAADVPMRFIALCEWSQLRIGGYFDGSWASRPDLSSQAGHLIFTIPESNIEDGSPVQLVVMDYRIGKAPRISRSSLSVEGQSAAIAVDSLEWVKSLLGIGGTAESTTRFRDSTEEVWQESFNH